MRARRAAPPGWNAEFGKDLVQVGSDGVMRQESCWPISLLVRPAAANIAI
jgi:hypothetical protein